MPGDSGLRKISFALIDQTRAVGNRRVAEIFGVIMDRELAAIDEGVRLFLGLQ